MFDFKFDWCSEMAGGIDLIDTQHQMLFRIGRDMEQLMISRTWEDSTKNLLDIVCELREYVSYHFYTEENLMLEYDYPNYATHKAFHDSFKKHIIEIDMHYLGEHPDKALPQLKDYLQDFVFNHILPEDLELCRYLKTCGMH